MAIAAYLLDIEGTTTPIDFVHKILFPFAKERIERFVSENFEALEAEIKQLAAEHAADKNYSSDFHPGSPASIAEYLRFLIDVDRKSTPLKSIQGRIWQAGYESGDLRSQIFERSPSFDGALPKPSSSHPVVVEPEEIAVSGFGIVVVALNFSIPPTAGKNIGAGEFVYATVFGTQDEPAVFVRA